jgi:regulatory protein
MLLKKDGERLVQRVYKPSLSVVSYRPMKTQATARDCFSVALRLLAQRDHSCLELSGKLVDRGFHQDQVQRAVDRCLRLRYLDDERFACAYIEQLQRRGYGCHRIQQRLVAKGVAHQIISTHLEPCCCDAVQIRDCRKAMAKKLKGSLHADDSSGARAKMYRFLSNRGFSPAIIRQVLDQG